METNANIAKSGLLIWAIRLLGSAGFLAVIFYFLPAGEIFRAAKQLQPIIWFSGLAIFMIGHLFASLKWRLLINARKTISISAAIRAHFAGLAANLFLPGVAGGDVVRAGIIMRAADDRAHIAMGSLIDRLLDMLGLIILASIGAVLALGGGLLNSQFINFIAIMAVGVTAAMASYLILRKVRIGAVQKITRKVDVLIADFIRQPLKLSACLAISMSIQSAFILTTIMLAQATGASSSAAQWFFAWPLAKLIAILPVSLAGLGVREAGLAAILGGFGAAPAKIVAASLLWQTILFAGGVIGGIVLVLTSYRKASTEALTSKNQSTIKS